jgi:hypothetical protein
MNNILKNKIKTLFPFLNWIKIIKVINLIKYLFYQIINFLMLPLTLFSTIWLKCVNMMGIKFINHEIFMTVGLFPLNDHYYNPLINPKKNLKKSLRKDRNLKGIDFNVNEQLVLLGKFNFQDKLLQFPINQINENEYFYNNGGFESGDSEYLYSIIRYFKPKKIIEIGCGNSTLMIRNGIISNKSEDLSHDCEHICIEPFEQPWLENLELTVIREKVEDLEISFFNQLEANDILFIDSSHIIRPQGDILFEYLEILPNLKQGVLIHIHDIFTPKDYLDDWIFKEHLFWNEQYLVEAFLSFNTDFKIIGALNFLYHNYNNLLSEKFPILAMQKNREPGSLWLIRDK